VRCECDQKGKQLACTERINPCDVRSQNAESSARKNQVGSREQERTGTTKYLIG
jgi:hypothetical protein